MTIDCRSEEGITIGLIDSIITNCVILSKRDLENEKVKEALEDLRSSSELSSILESEEDYGNDGDTSKAAKPWPGYHNWMEDQIDE